MSNQAIAMFADLDLLPCPFCGEKPEIEPKNPDVDGNAWGSVSCVNAECPANPSVSDGVHDDTLGSSHEYKKAAVKRWNTRF